MRQIRMQVALVATALLVAPIEAYADAVASIPVMPDSWSVPSSPQAACPYDEADLVPFSSVFSLAQQSAEATLTKGSMLVQVAWSGSISVQGSASLAVENVASSVTLPAGKKVLLDQSVTVSNLVIPADSELIFADKPGLKLTAAEIRVAGALRLGSASCGLRSSEIGIVLTGSKTHQSRTKGILVERGGSLAMHGRRWAPTWTRLAVTATKGTNVLSLQQPVDWEPGQTIVVVTTQLNDDLPSDDHQNEEHTIASVGEDGRTIELTEPLAFEHYGGVEYAGEVALLSRSVSVAGDAASEGERYGGHIVCKLGSVCSFASVEAYRMGQENVMGRYPFHLHMMGDVGEDTYIEDCAVHHSFFRAYTVHGTNKARLSRNVAFDISGSAYYLEDGAEVQNLFEFNLAAFVHLIAPVAHQGHGQKGVTVSTQSQRIVPTDVTAVGFYCTNAGNRWVGNSASGGFSGFHFPQVPKALGQSYAGNENYQPEKEALLEFNGNTAHSSGTYWSHGACIYLGGRLWEDSPGSHHYTYTSGRFQPGRLAGRFRLQNTKVFACNKGVLFWNPHGSAPEPHMMLESFEAYDVQKASSQLGNTYISGAIVTAHTGNTAADLPSKSEGFQLYDTNTLTIIADTQFRSFDRPGDVAIMDMTHSNIFKQQGMFAMRNVTFANMPYGQRFRHVLSYAWGGHEDECKGQKTKCPGTAGSSQTSSMIDFDGASQLPSPSAFGPAIMGADDTTEETNGRTNEWWHLDENCKHNADWGFYQCPTYGHRAVVSLFLVTGLHDSLPSTVRSRYGSEAVTGTMYHFGHDDRKIQLGLAGSPMITGPCCDIGWYLRPEGDMAAKELTFYLDQMLPGPDGLVLAASYPQGAGFDIQRCLVNCKAVRRGSSLQSVLDSSGDVYFVDGQGRLFLKLVDETNLKDFAYAGVRILRPGNRFNGGKGARYKVRSAFSGSGQVSMSVPNPLPPRPTLAPPPTAAATPAPKAAPTAAPTPAPTAAPTRAPTVAPTLAPTAAPTLAPTAAPTLAPTAAPTLAPTAAPTLAPTAAPTLAPTVAPTLAPIAAPTLAPTAAPTQAPTAATPSPGPMMDPACQEFCGLTNLQAEGAWCGKHKRDQQACAKSYVQGATWKQARPCGWIDGTCKTDRARSRACPDVAAWCARLASASPHPGPEPAPTLVPEAPPEPTQAPTPATAPAPTPSSPAPVSPAPVMDSSCKEFCGLRNLRAEGARCGKHRYDQQACTKSYLQGVFWKLSHPWAHPCAWIDGTCKVDRGRSRVCPDLAAWCASQ